MNQIICIPKFMKPLFMKSECNSLQQFKFKKGIEIEDLFIGEIHERNEISKFIDKYVNVLSFLYMLGFSFSY